MLFTEILAVSIYIAILLGIAFASFKRNQSSTDFMLGGRGLNFWLTALAAHASDMSSWIFMGYPYILFQMGIANAWLAIGLVVFMFINWHWIAPKIRVATEKFDSLTFATFFESRFHDTTGMLRIVVAVMNLLFFTIYISASFYGLGLLLETLFGIPYWLGLTLGVLVVTPYLFVGGYITLAWTDFFQGLFLLTVIVMVPLIAAKAIGGASVVQHELSTKNFFEGFIPSQTIGGYISSLFLMMSWGLGYFGQPHIITKFMGIRDVKKITYSKIIGMTWQIIIMISATLIGLVAVAFFKDGIDNPQLIFVEMVRSLFSPFIGTFILCAIIGATLTHADSLILVLASSLTEDLYKRVLRKTASSKELVLVSRLSILLVAIVAYLIAYNKISSIFSIVAYAWFGLGSAFGPLLIFSLYSKKTNKYGAVSGVFTGGIMAAVWPLFNELFAFNIPTLIPSFASSAFVIWLVSRATAHKTEIVHE